MKKQTVLTIIELNFKPQCRYKSIVKQTVIPIHCTKNQTIMPIE